MAHYLLSLGLVNPQSVIEEDLTVTDVSRRNQVFLVTSSRAPTYVLKQAGFGTAATLAREAAVLRVVKDVPGIATSTLVHYDAESVRLVLRSPPSATSWMAGSLLGAASLGRLLAAVHEVRPAIAASGPPFALSLAEPSHAQLRDMSAGALDVLSRIQANVRLCDRLQWLRETWAGDRLVHGDLKLDNCLLMAAPGSTKLTRAFLIDWEMAGPGDPAYDVGAALGDYVRLWITSMPMLDVSNTGRFADRARQPLERMQAAMRRCWTAYRARGPSIAPARAAETAAVRLLQVAMESVQGMARPDAHVMALVQVADNILRAPDAAALQLMGLSE